MGVAPVSEASKAGIDITRRDSGLISPMVSFKLFPFKTDDPMDSSLEDSPLRSAQICQRRCCSLYC